LPGAATLGGAYDGGGASPVGLSAIANETITVNTVSVLADICQVDLG